MRYPVGGDKTRLKEKRTGSYGRSDGAAKKRKRGEPESGQKRETGQRGWGLHSLLCIRKVARGHKAAAASQIQSDNAAEFGKETRVKGGN